MNQPSLEQQKLAQLEALAEMAKITEEKIRNFNQESQKMAEKWQNLVDKKHESVNYSEEKYDSLFQLIEKDNEIN